MVRRMEFPTLQSSGRATSANDFQINWEKVNVLHRLNETKNIALNNPCRNIHFSPKCEIVGHITTADKKLDESVNGRLRKGNMRGV